MFRRDRKVIRGSKGRTESSKVKHDCRQKLTNCAKRKATPGSKVDFRLPVGAKVDLRSQAEAARCAASCAAGYRSFFFFFFLFLPARGGVPAPLPWIRYCKGSIELSRNHVDMHPVEGTGESRASLDKQTVIIESSGALSTSH